MIIEAELPRAGFFRAGVVLLAALSLGISGCSGNKQTPQEVQQQAFEDVKAEIRSVVSDPDRAAQVVVLIDDLETRLDEVQAGLAQRKVTLRELNRDYDTPREAFDNEMALMRSEFRANEKRVSSVRQQLTEVLTDEEWAAIEKARSKALESALETAQST